MSSTSGEALPSTRSSAAPSPRRSGPAPGGTAPDATSCGTAKKLPSLQAGVSCVEPGDAVAAPALHLHARAPPRASPSRRAARARRCGGPAPRRARSRRSPPGRRHACRAPRGGRACRRCQCDSARAMRSRSMREWPVKKSIWWPTCSASRSRGWRMLRSSRMRPARCQLAVRQRAGRRHVLGLALGGRQRAAAACASRAAGSAGRLGAQQVQVGHQHMGHRHVRRLAPARPVPRPAGR